MYKWHEKMYKQFCLLWSSPVKDGYGQAIYDYPTQQKCRWHSVTEVKTNKDGEEFVPKVKVYVPASVVVAVGDYIKLGVLSDIDTNSWYDSDYDGDLLKPEEIDGAYRVERVDNDPSLCNTITVQIVWA